MVECLHSTVLSKPVDCQPGFHICIFVFIIQICLIFELHTHVYLCTFVCMCVYLKRHLFIYLSIPTLKDCSIQESVGSEILVVSFWRLQSQAHFSAFNLTVCCFLASTKSVLYLKPCTCVAFPPLPPHLSIKLVFSPSLSFIEVIKAALFS